MRDYFEASFWGAFQRVNGMIDEVARLTPLASIANFILVVEDDEDEATFLKELLEKHKYRVTVARDGGQAQATFVMRKPDFVILDLILPGESGFEVCQRLREQANSTVPVLVLTAVDMPEAQVLADARRRRRLFDQALRSRGASSPDSGHCVRNCGRAQRPGKGREEDPVLLPVRQAIQGQPDPSGQNLELPGVR